MSAIVPQPASITDSESAKRTVFIRTEYHGRDFGVLVLMRTWILLGVLGMALPRSGPEIVAHRGSSEEAPENTIASFRLGYEQADACELDIHLSKDGQVIVMHDANTKRTAGVDKPIAQQTLEELKALDAGKFKGEKFAGEK